MMNSITAAGGLVVAIGDNGKIETHAEDGRVQRHRVGTHHLHAVALHSGTLGYAVGEQGSCFRWDGQSWTRLQPFTTADLCSVAIAGPDDLLIGDVAGNLWRLDGQRPISLAEVPQASGQRRPAVTALWTAGAASVAAAGEDIYMWVGQRDARRWTLPSAQHLRGLCGTADGGVLYASGSGGAWRWQGVVWERIAKGDHAGRTCSADGTRLWTVVGAELREWTVNGGWRCLFQAPADLSSAALDEVGGAVWTCGGFSVYRVALVEHEELRPRARAAEDLMIRPVHAVPTVVINDERTVPYAVHDQEVRAC